MKRHTASTTPVPRVGGSEQTRPTRPKVLDSSSFFVHQPVVQQPSIIESDCVTCHLPIGAATQEKARVVMELSHLKVHHPRGLLRWFLRSGEFPSA